MRRSLSVRRPVGTKGAGLSLLGLMVLLPAAAQTIDAGAGDTPASPIATALPGATAAGSGLQLPGAGRSWRVVTRLAITETVTDNGRLSSTDRQAEAITQPSATVSMLSNGGRVRGFLDYTLSGLLYARGTSSNRLQNALNMATTTELVERRAFVEVAGTISQQAVSALGTQSIDPALATTNRTEVRTLRVSPYLRGQIPSFASYEARAGWTETHTTSALVSNSRTTTASARLTGLRTGRLNWSADVSRQVYDYSAGRRTETDRENVALLLTVDPQLRFSLNGGRETTNLTALEKQSYANYGLRMDWSPSVRTSVIADFQHRFFGTSRVLSLTHRTPRSAWLYSDTKDVSATGLASNVGVQDTPVLPVTPVTSGYFASSATIRRQQRLSFTLLGIRDTLTFSATRSDARPIDTIGPATNDFATFGRVQQQGLAVNYSHRLTPLSSLAVVLSQQRNSGSDSTSGASQSTTLRAATATLSGTVSRRVRASLTARHSRFESGTSPYRESAVIANVSLQF